MAAGVNEVVFLQYYEDQDRITFLAENNHGQIRFRAYSPEEVTPEEFLHGLFSIQDCSTRVLDRRWGISS
jgi:hypothetical protein